MPPVIPPDVPATSRIGVPDGVTHTEIVTFGDSVTAFASGGTTYNTPGDGGFLGQRIASVDTAGWFGSLKLYDLAGGYAGDVLGEDPLDNFLAGFLGNGGTTGTGDHVLASGDGRAGFTPNGVFQDQLELMLGDVPGHTVNVESYALGGSLLAGWANAVPDWRNDPVTALDPPVDAFWGFQKRTNSNKSMVEHIVDVSGTGQHIHFMFTLGGNDLLQVTGTNSGPRFDNVSYWSGKRSTEYTALIKIVEYLHWLTGGDPDSLTESERHGNCTVMHMQYPTFYIDDGEIQSMLPLGEWVLGEGRKKAFWCISGLTFHREWYLDMAEKATPAHAVSHPNIVVRPATAPNQEGPVPWADLMDWTKTSGPDWTTNDAWCLDNERIDNPRNTVPQRGSGTWGLAPVAPPVLNITTSLLGFILFGNPAVTYQWRYYAVLRDPEDLANGIYNVIVDEVGTPGEPGYKRRDINGWEIGARRINETYIGQHLDWIWRENYGFYVSNYLQGHFGDVGETVTAYWYAPTHRAAPAPEKSDLDPDHQPMRYDYWTDHIHPNYPGSQEWAELAFNLLAQQSDHLIAPLDRTKVWNGTEWVKASQVSVAESDTFTPVSYGLKRQDSGTWKIS